MPKNHRKLTLTKTFLVRLSKKEWVYLARVAKKLKVSGAEVLRRGLKLIQ